MKRFNFLRKNTNNVEYRLASLLGRDPIRSLAILLILLCGLKGSASAAYYPYGDEYEPSADATFSPALMRVSGGEAAIEQLKSEGVRVLGVRDDLVLALIPIADETGDKSNLKGRNRLKSRCKDIVRIEPGRKVVPAMDEARAWFGAEDIHNGESLLTPYTGRGVVTGICDVGFDPNHINFKDAQGNCRVKLFTVYNEENGGRKVYTTEEEFRTVLTDDPTQSHATHVSGIMAGSYKGNGYHGAAYESDIVFAASQLSDVGLLAGVEDIIAYAKSVGKPAVINLSMGNYVGPHDGSSLFCQYLDKCADDAIICLSAGNAGNQTNSLPHTFKSDNSRVSVSLSNYAWTQYYLYGMTDVWSHDDRPLRASVMVSDSQEGKIVAEFPIADFSQTDAWIIGSEGCEVTPNASADDNAAFSQYFTGWLALQGGIDPENGRYRVWAEYDANTSVTSANGPWARYVMILNIYGDKDTQADIYGDGQYTRLVGYNGSRPGSTMSFSDLSTGFRTVSVGMYNSRQFTPLLNGTMEAWGDYGKPNVNSSYATLLDGRVMPLTVAPGNPIVSSYSTPWVNHNISRRNELAAEAIVNGKSYYWKAGGGTSMSCPYVAGFIATWLEAAPQLKIDEILRIIEESNITGTESKRLRAAMPEDHNIDPAEPRNGRGWFDPLSALKSVLIATSVPVTDVAINKVRFTYDNGELTLWNPGGVATQVIIYTLDGRVAEQFTTAEAVSSRDMRHLNPGVYVCRSGEAVLKFVVPRS